MHGQRLMVYDTTDVRKKLSEIRRALSTDLQKLLPDDYRAIDLEIPAGNTYAWAAGGKLYSALGRLDDYKGFSDWGRALEWLNEKGRKKPIAKIEYWGHGGPGRVLMNGRSLTAASVTAGPYALALKALRTHLSKDALLWFRCCSVFACDDGHAFAKAWTEAMGCRVAAHTHVIGFWQAGTHSLRPGQEPGWSVNEGLAKGTPEKPTEMKTSGFGSPNRLWFMDDKVPEAW